MGNDANSAGAKQIAVIVVHGVGDTQPGAAMNELINTLAANSNGLLHAERHSEVYPLQVEPNAEGEVVDTFPAYARTATLADTGDTVRFYDLHWADLTRSLPGRLNAFLGSFRIIFEAHHFIDAILPKSQDRLTNFLRGLLIWAAAILRGPIVGTSAFLVAVGLMFYFSWQILLHFYSGNPDKLHVITVWLVTGVLVVSLLVALVAFLWRGRSRDSEWNDVLATIIIGSVLAVAYTWTVYSASAAEAARQSAHQSSSQPPMCLYIDTLYFAIQNMRVAWCGLTGIALGIVTWLYVRVWFWPGGVRPTAAMAALSVVVLQSALWLTLISALAIPLIHQAQLRGMATCRLEGLYVSFSGTALLLGVVGWVAFLTFATRYVLARLPGFNIERRAGLTPRMLFGGAITTAILIGGFFQVLVFGSVYTYDFINREIVTSLSQSLLKSAVGSAIEQINITTVADMFYAGASGVAVFASALIAGGFTTAIHIARDLIDHQYSPRRGFAHYLLPLRWREGHDRPRRQRIRERLNTLARELICDQSFNGVVFVAHSQGSVIVYDYLHAGGQECDRLLDVRPQLITLGSPLGHLYQFYFKEYADLERQIARLCPQLGSWTNIYRADDYVGRDIGINGNGFVQNKVTKAGGHVNYWTEPWLSDLVLARIRDAAATAAQPAPPRSVTTP